VGLKGGVGAFVYRGLAAPQKTDEGTVVYFSITIYKYYTKSEQVVGTATGRGNDCHLADKMSAGGSRWQF